LDDRQGSGISTLKACTGASFQGSCRPPCDPNVFRESRSDPSLNVCVPPRNSTAADAHGSRKIASADSTVKFRARKRTSLSHLTKAKEYLYHLEPHGFPRERPGPWVQPSRKLSAMCGNPGKNFGIPFRTLGRSSHLRVRFALRESLATVPQQLPYRLFIQSYPYSLQFILNLTDRIGSV